MNTAQSSALESGVPAHTPTDRELLELAARAAGIELGWDARGAYERLSGISGNSRHWTPLDDDGDAFRLAVKLNLDIGFTSLPDGPVVEVLCSWADKPHCDSQDLGKDAAAATRRAIVRAAAAIARATARNPSDSAGSASAVSEA